jgi:hypothetical protein
MRGCAPDWQIKRSPEERTMAIRRLCTMLVLAGLFSLAACEPEPDRDEPPVEVPPPAPGLENAATTAPNTMPPLDDEDGEEPLLDGR